MEDSREKEHWIVSYAFTFNSTIGSSTLAIPWAYSKAGIVYGLIIQVVTSVVSYVLSYQVIQTWSRFFLINKYVNKGYKIHPAPIKDIILNKSGKYVEKIKEEKHELHSDNEETNILSQSIRFEFYQITKITLGNS